MILIYLISMPGLVVPASSQRPALAAARRAPVLVERTSWHMGTRLAIRVAAPTETAGFGAIEAAFQAVDSVERVLSTWQDHTELSRLNRAPVGEWVAVSGGLAQLLATVRHWQATTGGAFDPAVGPLIDAWDLRGKQRDSDGVRSPTDAALETALAASGLHHFEFSRDGSAVRRLVSDAWLDAGAFGKGAALRDAIRALRERGITQGALDFGGQVVVMGTGRPSDPPVGNRVHVADPRARGTPLLTLAPENASVATSGQSERWVQVDGQPVGHILDPRSGRPAPAWGSVTVIHPDPVVADILATALYVMGPDDGTAWAEEHTVAALFVVAPPFEPSGAITIRCSQSMERYLVEATACG